jgi:hypothetical protein
MRNRMFFAERSCMTTAARLLRRPGYSDLNAVRVDSDPRSMPAYAGVARRQRRTSIGRSAIRQTAAVVLVIVGAGVACSGGDEPHREDTVPGMETTGTTAAPASRSVVPDVVGMTEAGGRAAIADAHLLMQVGSNDCAPAVTPGRICASDPPAGASVERDSTVTVMVASRQ